MNPIMFPLQTLVKGSTMNPGIGRSVPQGMLYQGFCTVELYITANMRDINAV